MARPKMAVPRGELSIAELVQRIEQWALSQGYLCEYRVTTKEGGRVTVRDPAGGYTFTDFPNPHMGRRLRKDQVRYTIGRLNSNWKG